MHKIQNNYGNNKCSGAGIQEKINVIKLKLSQNLFQKLNII